MTRDLIALKTRPSSSRLLARILETPALAAGVQSLPAPVLAKVIDAVGLEDAGEIVAFASPKQLAEVFDADLWRSDRPGGDERFDGDRFVVWLEVMMEAGDAFVAERLASLPEDLVALALHERLLVLDMDALLEEMRDMDADDDEVRALEKALANGLSEEIDEYRLVARRHDGWDAVLAAVLALDRDHHAVLARILERLCAMTAEYVEREGGLCDALTAEESLEGDVAADREDRRAEAGYVAPSDARAFLKLAKQKLTELPTEHDPVTRAYFRGLARGVDVASSGGVGASSGGGGASSGVGATSGGIGASSGGVGASGGAQSADVEQAVRGAEATGAEPSALARVLLEAGVVAPPGREIPRLGAGGRTAHEPLLVRAMRALAEIDAVAFAARSEEIAYLANVLVAGGSIDGRPYRPAEAVQKAVEVCGRGLELATKNARTVKEPDAVTSPDAATTPDTVTILRTHPAEGFFRLAWCSGDREAVSEKRTRPTSR